jgi:hypothetical protein
MPCQIVSLRISSYRGHSDGTDFDPVFGEKCGVIPKVYAAADNIAHIEDWAEMPADVLCRKTASVIAMVRP